MGPPRTVKRSNASIFFFRVHSMTLAVLLFDLGFDRIQVSQDLNIDWIRLDADLKYHVRNRILIATHFDITSAVKASEDMSNARYFRQMAPVHV